MTPFPLVAAKAFLALSALVQCATADSEARASAPNVLFFLSDDQDLLMNSMNFMPNVNASLGQHGLTFEKHYCTDALCCPSRTSLLSGQCVHNTNVTDVVLPWGAYPKFVSQGYNENYLPLWLQAGGVNTYYVGKFLNGHNTKNYQNPAVNGWNSSNFLLEPGTYDYYNTIWTLNNQQYQHYPGQNAINITGTNALSMLDTAVKDGGPFFLMIAPAVPHVGINSSGTFYPVPQTKWANAFPDQKVPRTPNWNPTVQKSGASWILNMPHQNETVVDAMDELYRSRIRCVAGLDDLVGDLVTSLENYGILDNTHFIYSTDNGYHIGQHRLGNGKKAGFETDVNIPMVWRGPGIPAGQTVKAVSTHTDLAPTFLSIFGVKQRAMFDGQIMPQVSGGSNNATDHINIEHWGDANAYEVNPWHSITVAGESNNTYKGLRLVTEDYAFYYAVWCTNEHELYNMKTDPYQTTNILPQTYNITSLPDTTENGWTLTKLVHRLDALVMVLKSCVGIVCIQPWPVLHPQGNVHSLQDAMNTKYDAFYASQPKVSFSACLGGYIISNEGPQKVTPYPG